MIVKNKSQLLSQGNIEGRRIALNLVEYAITVVNAYAAAKKRIQRKGDRFTVDNLQYDLSSLGQIYVVGGGKASFPIAQALEEIFNERIAKGVVSVKRGESRRLRRIEVIEAGHPIPDEKSLEAGNKIVELAKNVKKGDIVFCAISGGASALLSLPAGDITLEDKREITDMLLKCGARIDEINCVRNHISSIKGGKLAELLREAEIINLIIIDEVAGQPWGPTAPDNTTFQDAVNVLEKYDLWKKTSDTVKDYLERGRGDPSLETPKSFEDLRIHNVILADNQIMCEAVEKKARELGLKPLILSTVTEAESREAGIVLGSIAREAELRNRPAAPPCVLIMGGETTVTIPSQHGKGGPSQEFALGACLKIAGSESITVVSIDTDGTDGPTDIAGGITDGFTLERAKKNNIDIYRGLITHNAYEVLMEIRDAVITEPTDTNVMDLNLAVVIREK